MTFTELINHTSRSITTAAVVLGGASLISRILGLIRDRLLTHQFGAGAVLDSYYAAFRIPDLLFNLLVLGVLSAAFIPIFSDFFAKDEQRAWDFLNRTLSTLGVIFLGLSVACAIAAPLLMVLVAPGFEGEKREQTILLTRIMMLSPVLMGLSSLVGGALQSLKKFLIFALAPIMYNIGIIFGITIFVPLFGISGLALGVVLGALLHLLVQFPALLTSGFRPSWKWSPEHKDISAMIRLMGPRVLALAATQINLVIITIFASTLGDGAVATFNLANNIQYVPIGLIAVSFAVAAFPVMTAYVAEENPDGLSRTIGQTVRTIFVFIVPITILLITLRAQWVRIILGSGAFDWDATVQTADALGFFALGLVGQSLVHLFARAFYALKNTRIPALCGMASVFVGALLAFFLKDELGVSGLALAIAIQETLNALLLWILLSRHIGSVQNELTLKTIYKLSIAGLVMVLITQGIKLPIATFVNTHTFFGIFTQALGATIAGTIAFLTVGLLLKIEEVYAMLSATKIRVKKIASILPIDWIDATDQR